MNPLTHLKRPWCWESLRAGGEGDDRGWDGWMVSPTQWTWVWVNSGNCCWTGRPCVLQFMGLPRVRHDWVAELTDDLHVCVHAKSLQLCPILCNLTECSLPGSSVHGLLQARILEWVALTSFKASSLPRDQTPVSHIYLHWQVASLLLAPHGKFHYSYVESKIVKPIGAKGRMPGREKWAEIDKGEPSFSYLRINNFWKYAIHQCDYC